MNVKNLNHTGLSDSQIKHLSEIDKDKDFSKWYCAFSAMIAKNCKPNGSQINWKRKKTEK